MTTEAIRVLRLLFIVALSAGCGDNSVAALDAGTDIDGDVLADAASDVASDASPSSRPSHVLSIDTTLDADDSTAKATSFRQPSAWT